MVILNKKLRNIWFAFLCLMLSLSFGFAESKSPKIDTNAKIKAVFLYNFTKYIEWPSDYKNGNFVVGILGNSSSLYKELTIMSKTKKVASQDFEIRVYTSPDEISDKVHMLYIPDESSSKFTSAVKKLKGKSTLIVTETPGLSVKGSGINFVVVENRQKFELNKSNVEGHNLKVSKSLEDLALVVK
tara:strand:- start:327 stop:884 length:558 start_codon:yes stop_codon:yes gene_type:complete